MKMQLACKICEREFAYEGKPSRKPATCGSDQCVRKSKGHQGKSHPAHGRKGKDHWSFGQKRTAETRQKIAEKALQRDPSTRKHTMETRRRLSLGKRGSLNPMFGRCGSDAPMSGKVIPWFEPWMKDLPGRGSWIRSVKRSADERCIRCYSSEELRAHHIIPISVAPDRMLDLANGLCLCHDCHVHAHRILRNHPDIYRQVMIELKEVERSS